MPPVNDDFASATVLTGDSGHVTFSNVGATTEAGEPANAEGHSVWFQWTPSIDGDAYMRTGLTPLPDWDSYIAVHTGTSLADLVEVASADDNDLQVGHADPYGTSKATWTAVAGTTYWIQVTAYDDVSGPVERSNARLDWFVGAPLLFDVFSIDSETKPTLPTGDADAGDALTVSGDNLTDVVSIHIDGAVVPIISAASGVLQCGPLPDPMAGGDKTLDFTGSNGAVLNAPLFILHRGPWVQPPDQWADYLLPDYWSNTPWRDVLVADGITYENPDTGHPSTSLEWATMREVGTGSFGPGFTDSYEGEWTTIRLSAFVVDLVRLLADPDAAPPLDPTLPAHAIYVETESDHGTPHRVRGRFTRNWLLSQEWNDPHPQPPTPTMWTAPVEVRRLATYNYDAGETYPSSTPVRDDFIPASEVAAGALLGTFPATPPSFDVTALTPGESSPVTKADPFTRADGDPLGFGAPFGWSEQTVPPGQPVVWGVRSNRAQCLHTGPVVGTNYRTGDLAMDALAWPTGVDISYCTISVTYAALDASSTAGVFFGGAVGVSTPQDFFRANKTNLRHIRYEGSTLVDDTLVLDYSGVGFAAGDRLTVLYDVSRITIYKNGVEVAHVDGEFAGEHAAGMFQNSADVNTFLDDFEVTTTPDWLILYGGPGPGPTDTYADDVFDLALADLDLGGTRFAAVVAPELWIDGTPAIESLAAGEINRVIDTGASLLTSFWYSPPRYRFLFTTPQARPPLGHRQRRDGTATDGPPLAHFQGADGATRPSLAHRQNTP